MVANKLRTTARASFRSGTSRRLAAMQNLVVIEVTADIKQAELIKLDF
jgi:hypothetical protein